ncbi:hypothetical protein [Mesorhizobium amorphae]|uniref:hypothetical protein n=1 Tax=Mesorhizobium amorphae TaxID=71433 RepID=UPI001AED9EDE
MPCARTGSLLAAAPGRRPVAADHRQSAQSAGTADTGSPDRPCLEAGDHNGSTYFEHARFTAAVRGQGKVEVTLQDGWWAVVMGLAAQTSAREGRAIELASEFALPT